MHCLRFINILLLSPLAQGWSIFYCLAQESSICYCLAQRSSIFYCLAQGQSIFYCLPQGSSIFYCLPQGSTIFFCLLQGSTIFFCLAYWPKDHPYFKFRLLFQPVEALSLKKFQKLICSGREEDILTWCNFYLILFHLGGQLWRLKVLQPPSDRKLTSHRWSDFSWWDWQSFYRFFQCDLRCLWEISSIHSRSWSLFNYLTFQTSINFYLDHGIPTL